MRATSTKKTSDSNGEAKPEAENTQRPAEMIENKGTGNIPTWIGSGPAPGVLGVNSSSNSIKAINNYHPKQGGIEFVYDAKTNTFVVGSPKNGAFSGSPHQKLAQRINADGGKTTLGGMFSRGPNGEIRTTEYSGHSGQNWTPELRKQFQKIMESYGLRLNMKVGEN